MTPHRTDAQFPVLYGSRGRDTSLLSVPWAMLAPHEERAKRNHCGQSLETLARRGGLSPSEMLYILDDRGWTMGGAEVPDATSELKRRVAAYVAPNSGRQPAAASSPHADDGR